MHLVLARKYMRLSSAQIRSRLVRLVAKLGTHPLVLHLSAEELSEISQHCPRMQSHFLELKLVDAQAAWQFAPTLRQLSLQTHMEYRHMKADEVTRERVFRAALDATCELDYFQCLELD